MIAGNKYLLFTLILHTFMVYAEVNNDMYLV